MGPRKNSLPGSFLLTRLTRIPVWISNYTHYKVRDEIPYPFPNFNGATVEVWESICNFILHFRGQVIIRAGININPC